MEERRKGQANNLGDIISGWKTRERCRKKKNRCSCWWL